MVQALLAQNKALNSHRGCEATQLGNPLARLLQPSSTPSDWQQNSPVRRGSDAASWAAQKAYDRVRASRTEEEAQAVYDKVHRFWSTRQGAERASGCTWEMPCSEADSKGSSEEVAHEEEEEEEVDSHFGSGEEKGDHSGSADSEELERTVEPSPRPPFESRGWDEGKKDRYKRQEGTSLGRKVQSVPIRNSPDLRRSDDLGNRGKGYDAEERSGVSWVSGSKGRKWKRWDPTTGCWLPTHSSRGARRKKRHPHRSREETDREPHFSEQVLKTDSVRAQEQQAAECAAQLTTVVGQPRARASCATTPPHAEERSGVAEALLQEKERQLEAVLVKLESCRPGDPVAAVVRSEMLRQHARVPSISQTAGPTVRNCRTEDIPSELYGCSFRQYIFCRHLQRRYLSPKQQGNLAENLEIISRAADTLTTS